jgi:type VI secretion system protein ImpH
MARKARGKTPGIKERLLREGPRFSYVQVARLLRYVITRESPAPTGERELESRLRVRPELSLSYPESDVSRVEEIPGEPSRYAIEATFLGLYGSSSPLPTFYTEDLLYEREDERSVSREFLDILNSPLYALYFRIWSKYRLLDRIVENPDAKTLERLFCLAGLSGETLHGQFPDPFGLLRFSGLTTHFPRSADGLRSMLSDRFGEPSLRIEQCVVRVAVIPPDQRTALGKTANRLGRDSLLGTEITDRMGKFRVHLGPAGGETLHRFLPDRPDHAEMAGLIRFYLDQPLDWDLEITLRGVDVQPACPGSPVWSQLGWNTWVFSEHVLGERVSVKIS